LLEQDTGNIYLTPEALDASDEDPSNQLLGSSITYRIAVGPQQGRQVFTLQTLPDCESESPFVSTVGEVAGFSLHAGVATKANEPENGLTRLSLRPARIRSQRRSPCGASVLDKTWRAGTWS